VILWLLLQVELYNGWAFWSNGLPTEGSSYVWEGEWNRPPLHQHRVHALGPLLLCQQPDLNGKAFWYFSRQRLTILHTSFCPPELGTEASLSSPIPITPGTRRKPPRGCPDRLQHRPDPPRRRRVRLVPQVPREGLGAQPKVPRTKVTQGKQSVTLVEYSQFTECIY